MKIKVIVSVSFILLVAVKRNRFRKADPNIHHTGVFIAHDGNIPFAIAGCIFCKGDNSRIDLAPAFCKIAWSIFFVMQIVYAFPKCIQAIGSRSS
jgi:hypothetical protein